jgi:malate/lactate dehydrogenase
VPCILSQKGVERILQANLTPNEQNALVRSATVLQEMIAQLNLPGAAR